MILEAGFAPDRRARIVASTLGRAETGLSPSANDCIFRTDVRARHLLSALKILCGRGNCKRLNFTEARRSCSDENAHFAVEAFVEMREDQEVLAFPKLPDHTFL